MPSYQDVLDIFKDYLDTDPDVDVVITRHACAVMLWDPVCKRYTSTVTCRSGKELFDQLLRNHASYYRFFDAGETPPTTFFQQKQAFSHRYANLVNRERISEKIER